MLIPVEVKVNKDTENDLKGQVIKYCNVEKCYLNKDDEASSLPRRLLSIHMILRSQPSKPFST